MNYRLKEFLDHIYEKYNHRGFVSPDPLQTLYEFSSPEDIEIAGIIASSFAYGRVMQILATLKKIFARLGSSPADYLDSASETTIQKDFSDIIHRFTTPQETIGLFTAMKRLRSEFGNLENLILARKCETVREMQVVLVSNLLNKAGLEKSSLLPDPRRDSACKRLNLMFRWLVRADSVDLGIWKSISPSVLTVPLDTHMFKVAHLLELTSRNDAGHKTALEITKAFGALTPEDPVKYDFALTRFGIHPDFNYRDFHEEKNSFDSEF
ncbi:TIGR02757 family protein [Myxococcota bacterium]|nr:TIGR02757 family protein [Myxococcota bacterium]MBU1382742.1 TIGR02757 family protein [Myxococcota bacterium]MBU1498280.1 TIGR02757 family protein [Myxococcota bacterium]